MKSRGLRRKDTELGKIGVQLPEAKKIKPIMPKRITSKDLDEIWDALTSPKGITPGAKFYTQGNQEIGIDDVMWAVCQDTIALGENEKALDRLHTLSEHDNVKIDNTKSLAVQNEMERVAGLIEQSIAEPTEKLEFGPAVAAAIPPGRQGMSLRSQIVVAGVGLGIAAVLLVVPKMIGRKIQSAIPPKPPAQQVQVDVTAQEPTAPTTVVTSTQRPAVTRPVPKPEELKPPKIKNQEAWAEYARNLLGFELYGEWKAKIGDKEGVVIFRNLGNGTAYDVKMGGKTHTGGVMAGGKGWVQIGPDKKNELTHVQDATGEHLRGTVGGQRWELNR